MKERKVHKGCGGKVIWQEPDFPAYYEFAGLCTKCGAFPLAEEEIEFKKGLCCDRATCDSDDKARHFRGKVCASCRMACDKCIEKEEEEILKMVFRSVK